VDRRLLALVSPVALLAAVSAVAVPVVVWCFSIDLNLDPRLAMFVGEA
jgi:hypothetical protein